MSNQMEFDLGMEEIKLPEIGNIVVKVPEINEKEETIDTNEIMESVQQSFPFMHVQSNN